MIIDIKRPRGDDDGCDDTHETKQKRKKIRTALSTIFFITLTAKNCMTSDASRAHATSAPVEFFLIARQELREVGSIRRSEVRSNKKQHLTG